MDCGSFPTTDTITGIDPKILENWRSESSSVSFPSWTRPELNKPCLESDISHDLHDDDPKAVDSVSTLPIPGRRRLETAMLDPGDGYPTWEFGMPSRLHEKMNLIGRAFESRVLPLSDDRPPQQSWTQFRLSDAITVGMPPDAVILSPFVKEPSGSLGTVILDDADDLIRGEAFSDLQSDQMPSLEQLSHTFQHGSDAWSTPLNSATSCVPSQLSISPPLESLPDEKDLDLTVPELAVDPRWFTGSVDVHGSQNPVSSLHSPTLEFYDGPRRATELQHESEGSPLAEDISRVFESPYDVPVFAERQVKEEESPTMEWHHSSVESSPLETSKSPLTVSTSTSSRNSLELSPTGSSGGDSVAAVVHTGGGRPAPLLLQPVSRRRKQRNVTAVVEQIHQPRPLQIVQEDGQGGSIASEDFVSPPRGARRKGPLTTVGRANAGLRRKNRDTCVQCRLNKRKCDGNSPCDACHPTLHEQPCARACFSSIVEYGTCNYISQRAINHSTLDSSSRVRMEIPSAFNLDDLVSYLGERRGRFNIRARQSWGSLYILDLAETYKFLKVLNEYNGNSQSTFLEFIDHRIIESKDKSKYWLNCIKDCDPMRNVYALLSQWNNMPSRASYSYVSLEPGVQDRPMNVNDSTDREEILLAAQLSRIFCRMLEVEGFRKLERDFYNIKWKRISMDTHLQFLNDLGRILLSLRWRVSWWKRLGDGGAQPDPSQQHYVERVELLCRILYVYYTSVLGKLPSWSAADVPKGVWSTYADAEKPIWDDFPLDATENGFHQWVARGRELIEQAGVPGFVSSHITLRK